MRGITHIFHNFHFISQCPNPENRGNKNKLLQPYLLKAIMLLHLLSKDKRMKKKLDGSHGERSRKKKQKNYYHYLRRWERKEEKRERKCVRHFSRSLWEEAFDW